MIDIAAVKERVLLEDAFQLLGIDYPVTGKRQPKMLCPFQGHDERSPSCTLYLDENRVWCFGCNRGGDVIDLVQLVLGVDFVEAAQQLADYAGIHEINGSRPQRDLSSRELFQVVADQAHADVVGWMKRHEVTVEKADSIFERYDEIVRAERAEEITPQAATIELLNWRAQWKARLI